MKIIQMVPTLNFGDAVGNEIIAIADLLTKENIKNEVYAYDIDSRLVDKAKHCDDDLDIDSSDIIIYHMAVGSGMADYIVKQKCFKIMRYHNITPPGFFLPYDENATYACTYGLKQVKEMADEFDFCMPVSTFNKNDLIKYGYKCPMMVVPIIIKYEDYKKNIDSDIYEKFNDGKTNIMFLGRFAPNKKWEDVVSAFYQYKKNWNANSRLIMVGSYNEADPYYIRLKEYIDKLQIEDIVFTGHISFPGILACYSVSDLFLCLSEHEGFCVPLVEAMVFRKPIVAYKSCAVPETMGEGTVVLRDKKPLVVAGFINKILKDDVLRKRILQNQDEQLATFDAEIVKNRFLEVLKMILKER